MHDHSSRDSGSTTGCGSSQHEARRVRVLTYLALAALRDGAPERALQILESALAGPFDAGLSRLLDLALVEAERRS